MGLAAALLSLSVAAAQAETRTLDLVCNIEQMFDFRDGRTSPAGGRNYWQFAVNGEGWFPVQIPLVCGARTTQFSTIGNVIQVSCALITAQSRLGSSAVINFVTGQYEETFSVNGKKEVSYTGKCEETAPGS